MPKQSNTNSDIKQYRAFYERCAFRVESCMALAEHHDGRWKLLHHKPKHIRKKNPSKAQLHTEIPLGQILSPINDDGSERET